MSHQIQIWAQTRTVCVIHEGILDLTGMESGRAQGVAALTEHGFSRLLVDTRAVNRDPTVTEHHRFASTQALYMPLHIVVAVVVRPAVFESTPAFEKFSVDRGVQIKAFVDIDEAQAWLMRVTN
ncbi:hypothetical protein [Aquabacterium sp.]|uniref:hypothetical protein n=1 Tax=Aquabacterium sp. TaxID=1872578 RepID=UPI0024885047|nr:hypothetical protein [Aquabacterium sp.]MDI1260307.1 hypothetical protein [Aquabacterium sp.]